MNSSPQLPIQGLWAKRVFACFAFAYFLSYAFRSVNAVIAPELIADMQLSNAQLGLLSSAYFVGFALMQIPLGFALDKFGVRRTESILLLSALMGALIFASSMHVWGLTLGRFLIGVGVSACLMGAFTAYRRWFAIHQQGQLASGMLVFGTLGALLTTIPVQWLMSFIGWRGVFIVTAVLVGFAVLGIRYGLPTFDDQPVQNNHQQDDSIPTDFSFQQIITHPFFIRMLPLGVLCHGGFMAIQTLWVGPWMVNVMGFEPAVSAQILFLFNGVMLLGYAFNAWFVPRINRQGIKTLDYLKYLVGLGLVAEFLAISSSHPYSWILWIIFAGTATVHILGQSSVGTVFPSHVAGRANTSYNLVIFIGAFLAQWAIGWALDLTIQMGIDKPIAYKQVFFGFFVLQVLAYLWFMFFPKPPQHHLAGA